MKSAAWMLFGASMWLFLAPGLATAEDLSATAVYEQTVHSTCWVRLPNGWGSGVLVDKERKIVLTSCHVVLKAKDVNVWFPVYDKGKLVIEQGQFERKGQPIHGKILAREQTCDLALIQLDSIPADVTEIKLAAEEPSPGDRLHSVGHGQKNGVLFGYHAGYVCQVCQENDSYAGGRVNCRILESQCPHNPGDSGGPTVNDKGELVGITSSFEFPPTQLISCHIAVSEVRAYMKKVLK